MKKDILQLPLNDGCPQWFLAPLLSDRGVRLFRCFVERGRIEARVPPILRRLGLSESQWQKQVSATKSRYCRAIGSLDSLLRLTETLGRNWIRGTSFARAIARNS